MPKLTFKPLRLPEIVTVETPEIPVIIDAYNPAVIGEYTYVAGPVPFPFVITNVLFLGGIWDVGDDLVYLLVGRNPDVGVTGPPPDFDVLNFGGCRNPLTAPAITNVTSFQPNLVILEKNTYLKVHCSHTVAGIRAILVVVTIRPYTERL